MDYNDARITNLDFDNQLKQAQTYLAQQQGLTESTKRTLNLALARYQDIQSDIDYWYSQVKRSNYGHNEAWDRVITERNEHAAREVTASNTVKLHEKEYQAKLADYEERILRAKRDARRVSFEGDFENTPIAGTISLLSDYLLAKVNRLTAGLTSGAQSLDATKNAVK